MGNVMEEGSMSSFVAGYEKLSGCRRLSAFVIVVVVGDCEGVEIC